MDLFGKNLRKKSRELGLSDSEVARRLGISDARYGNYARGVREPDYAMLLRICKTLGTTPDALFGLSDGPKSGRRGVLENKLLSACASLGADDIELVLEMIGAFIKNRRKAKRA